MKIKTFVIDAFTNQAFKGNPAGVCLLDKALDETTMLQIAAEMNHSETAFLLQDPTDDNHFSIRYFTPQVEIQFCGHATLASSKLILHRLKRKKVEFTTHFNLKLAATSKGKAITMRFPLYGTSTYTPKPELYAALGIQNPLNTRYTEAIGMLLVEVSDKQTLLALQPDFVKMVASDQVIKEVVVTTQSEDVEYDFYSRCFCPWVGINEDPVTGAVHTVLAKYWGDKLGKAEMIAYQCSKRSGFMALKIVDAQTLEVTSEAQVVLEGHIYINNA